MELSDILKTYKNKTGFSDEFIALKLGVNRSTISRWVSGETKKISPEMIDKLSELLKVDINEVLTTSIFGVKKPILGHTKAGYDMFLEENFLGYELVNGQEDNLGDYFLVVEGDSMTGAKIFDKDLVYVKKTDFVENNSIAIVLINDEVTIKRVVYKDEILILEAANSSYKNMYFTKDEVESLPVKIIGKVIYSKTIF